MNWLEKILNRYNIVTYIVIFLMFLLSFRLATLTIVKGDEYRDMADNKRLKEIYVSAPRGEIRDRYGRLLAGNKPSFTVQLLKDELDIKDKDKKNEALLSLVRLLEEDGVSYIDDFPINLNSFKYKAEKDYFEESLMPDDKVVDIIINHNLIGELLEASYIHQEYQEHYKFSIIEKAINALEDKDIEVTREGLMVGELVRLINNDKIIIRKIIDHPISRKLTYEILTKKNLAENIIMEEYSLSYDEEYKEQKRNLMNSYPEVTAKTTGKQDFVNIVMKTSINNILEKVIEKENDKGKSEIIVPGKILLDMVLEKNPNVPIKIELSEDSSNVIYKYLGSDDIGDKSSTDILVEYGKKAGIMEEFITSDDIKTLAQEQLLNNGINPKISIAKDFEYVFINNKKRWYNENNIDEESTVREAFEALKEKYKISKELSSYEARSILTLYEVLNKQGHFAYQPINIAYGIKNSTVAKIEEGLSDLPGIQVSIEPVRYYPEKSTAAHILGYLGKISQPNEIKKYVDENGYSPNDIIGKTGVEESFEDVLRGENGIKRVEVDALGNTTNTLDEKSPVPGDNLYLTIDLKLQKLAESVLQQTLEKVQVGGTYESPWGNYKFGTNRKKGRPYVNATSGAVVATNVKTGEVLAMASYPAYDPNLFSTGISNADWLSLFPEHDKDPLAPRPLYNIAIQTAVQPGSIFKMVTGLAGLEKGMSPTKAIRDMGYVQVGSYTPGCWIWNQSRGTHGYENLYDAIRDSCNYYFYTLALGRNQRTGENIGVKLELEDIVDLSKQLGLNDKSGIEINIPAEVSGGVPDPQRKVITTKAMLKSELRGNIEKYIKEDTVLDQDTIQDIIEEIVSWTELEEPLSRGEVIRRLDAFGLEPEKKLLGKKEGLADRIKFSYLQQAGWNISDTLNVTIGQGQNSYSPIQMANYIATISNGGYRHKATLVDNVKNYNNSKIILNNEPEGERIALNNYENLDHIKKAMLAVSNDGSSRKIFGKFPVQVGSKTGTAQRGGVNPYTGDTYDDFAWFVAFAPYEDPEIAVSVVLFQGGSGGYAGPMARDIIAEYLGLNAVGTKESLPFKNSLSE
ncbi:penicillin-binding transpeptidase domain-containing protein [Tissierella sp. MB52-C2]|uniref:penicillin-binding transpeptidase domain-containing protein n=1 Tax=Tissierella sp. MB52-C2 TaxID=3070999 RepID=UPI00280BF918|nr:penicillin-binding transpeptidase domain-containing protein [Tissierella sp. MB52-C2]WMM23555.1 penicillin-binding transpeptidase domain-containing protein [Tissierella sp. MB52-C2]